MTRQADVSECVIPLPAEEGHKGRMLGRQATRDGPLTLSNYLDFLVYATQQQYQGRGRTIAGTYLTTVDVTGDDCRCPSENHLNAKGNAMSRSPIAILHVAVMPLASICAWLSGGLQVNMPLSCELIWFDILTQVSFLITATSFYA
jgi:hypothetical protein